MVLVLTVAFLVAGLTAWLPARLSVVAENSSRMSRPNTVTTPMAAMAIRATMIRYSLMPWPDWDLKSLRRKRRIDELLLRAWGESFAFVPGRYMLTGFLLICTGSEPLIPFWASR